MRPRRKRQALIAVIGATALAGLGAGLGIGPTGLAAQAATRHLADLTSSAPVTVVASGLNGPRSLVWGPDHHLLVAEAGIPGSVCTGAGPTASCYGLTGSISDISSGTPVRIVTGLATSPGTAAQNGVAGLAYADGRLYALEAESPQAVPAGLPADLTATLRTESGALLNVTHGNVSVVANPGSVDYQWSQAHQSLLPKSFPGADPYALTPRPDGGFYLVDAASDTLDSVDRHGHVRVLAFVPITPAGTGALPTCAAVGPDGAVYVGELTGFGNSGTAANVYRYAPWSGRLTVWQSGFSAINGCGFGANGDFYVTELDTTGFPPSGPPNGAVIQISRDGTRTVLGAGKLFAPAGFLAGPDGSIYVSDNSLFPNPAAPTVTGRVVKIG